MLPPKIKTKDLLPTKRLRTNIIFLQSVGVDVLGDPFKIKRFFVNQQGEPLRSGGFSSSKLLCNLLTPLLPFSNDREVSLSADSDSGRHPKTLRAFEKARPKLSLRGWCEYSLSPNYSKSSSDTSGISSVAYFFIIPLAFASASATAVIPSAP